MKDDSGLFSVRLKALRKQKDIRQPDFARELSIFMGLDKRIATSTISSWEVGSRVPTPNTMRALANYFGVTLDYLLGRVESTNDTAKEMLFLEDFIIEIDEKKLPDYDGKPVYLVFSGSFNNRWGIYNKDKNQFLCRDEIVVNNSGIRYFATVPDNFPKSIRKSKPITLQELNEKEDFWIEYFSGDEITNKKFSGWYRHTEKHDAIINTEGNILPYQGINLYYHAYHDNL